MTATLLLVAFLVFAVGATIDLLAGIGAPLSRMLPYLAAAVGSGCLAASGALAVTGAPGEIGIGNLLGFGATALRVDPLAGLFLTVSGAVGVAVSLAAAGWARPEHRVHGRGLGSAWSLTLVGIALVMTAGGAFVFLIGWEAVTFAFYLLAGHRRGPTQTARDSFLTLAVGKASGAALLLGFLLLTSTSGSVQIDSWASVPDNGARQAAYVLLILGFGAKVGLVPLQIWMPRGYAAAPGPSRALMAGVAVNVGFYGLWRCLAVLGAPPTWLVIVVLLGAGFTALLGIAHATVQHDLARVVAYSSVENGGLIVAGWAVAASGALAGVPRLEVLGLLTATLQLVAHAMAKSALFLAVSTIEEATGSTELNDLSGLGRLLPWHGAGFAAGALTLAGLPITVGFVSEWFLLESFMQLFRVDGLGLQLAMAISGAAVALTAGFAAVAFVRILGLSVLGSAPSVAPPRDPADEGGWLGRIGVALPAFGCMVVAGLAPYEVGFIANGLAPVVPPHLVAQAIKSPWVLQPVFADFSILSPSWLWITFPVGLIGLAGLVLVLSRGAALRVRRTPAWHSATGGVSGPDRYTAFGFANPTRHVLANLLLTRTELRELDPEDPSGTNLGYTADVIEVVDHFLYRPLLSPLGWIVRAAKSLQSGRLDAYLAYMLLALVALIAAAAALS
ncbi:MAG TPA: proton-conducting transporter membrane subunit [Nocardioidaceae bacterium]|nr:proton-conducting transporter membrane subunit [Nocardioidaceae bacterium]